MLSQNIIQVAVIAFACSSAVLAACSEDNDDYVAGVEQATLQWDSAYDYRGNECNQIVFINAVLESNTPTSPACLQEGYAAGLNTAYNSALNECGDCQGVPSYDQGVNQAVVQWNAAWSYIDDCKKIDTAYKQVSSAGPNSPECLEAGFEAGLEAKYDAQLIKCEPECEEYGEDYANSVWSSEREKYGEDCANLDKAFEEANKKTPAIPTCYNQAYVNQINTLYTDSLDSCVDTCIANGEDQGERLAQQFCGISSGIELYNSPLTLVICNDQEKQACLTTFDETTMSDCPTNRDIPDNQEYYEALQASCAITIGPDAGK
ncbi:hypothetical protein SARC_03024 [Sphaeroforma arctica JP610]|uniref:Uncharacterized protein n=1 Tax=Sphaeroforma arctica JP610 TaxID=667725 RepID=A0A0L0G6X9_9EUKA|nr:hypothetical protein SARC_03024 [Sphaeroforma arctica JP610]KNC84782.1 hypothetical protein SARC_03024 [Sphaeroforma arctica JP610]|eukprot:XP_014158684.1 hypothetical protein SARC_03024 [Sphaeroforma arctica JP610]